MTLKLYDGLWVSFKWAFKLFAQSQLAHEHLQALESRDTRPVS